MQLKREIFAEKGIVVLNNAIPNELVLFINNIIIFWIKNYANELICSVEDYLTSVSRWAHPCMMINQFYQWVEAPLIDIASKFIGQDVRLHKINIISKSAYSDLPVPCHQDISYSREDPYEFSLWVALQDVGLSDGVLEFLPYSQKEKIEPAVDFWFPYFIDSIYLSSRWQKNSISVPVKAGDVIVFDSRIWHRSAQNTSGKNRFALVTRWSRINYQLSMEIPEKRPLNFGMWTCAKVTQSLLIQGLEKILQQPLNTDLAATIGLCQQWLNINEELPFMIDKYQAQKNLRAVSILHYSATHHNGGDAQGKVYAHVWHSILKPMVHWLNPKI